MSSQVKVKRRSGTPKTRNVYQLVGAGTSDVFGIHNSSLKNLERGVVERIFAVDYGKGLQRPLKPDLARFRTLLKPAFRFLRRNSIQLGRYTAEQFIECYRGDARKVRRYEGAAKSLLLHGVCRKDAEVKTFIKAEKCNFSAKRDPAPRVISPRDPRYNIELGRYIKPLEGVLYKKLNHMCGGLTVMKGLNADECGQAIADAWNSFADPVALGCDAKRFDQHTGPEALRYEQEVYKMFYHGEDRADLAELLSWQLKFPCRGYTPEGVVKFMMESRASGDMNTGLGTCLIAVSMVYCYGLKVGLDYRLIDNGDDLVLICERSDEHKLAGFHDFCIELGYFMVVEDPVYILEKIKFCQASPVLTAEGTYRMVRDFPVSISKDMVSLLPLRNEKDWQRWANDVGTCGLALSSGIPVTQSFYLCLKRSGSGTWGPHPWHVGTGASYLARGLESREVKITEATRYSFYLAFGLAPAEQEAIEQHYCSVRYNFTDDLQGYNIENITNKPKHYYFNNLLSNF